MPRPDVPFLVRRRHTYYTVHNGCECAHSTDGVSGSSITYRSHRWQKLMKPCLSSSKYHAFHTSPYHLLWTLSLPPRGINHFSEDSHIQNWVLFLLRLHPFILCGVISPLISSSILGTYRPGEFIFQCPIFLPFQTVHGVLKARILMWFVIPFSSDHILSDLSTMTRPFGWPHTAWLSFIELDTTVFHVIRLASCLWLWFKSVCPLTPSLSTYRLTWVSLTLNEGGSARLLLPTLDLG